MGKLKRLESINVDEEAMQFYIDYSIDELWKSAFRDKENTVLAVKREGKMQYTSACFCLTCNLGIMNRFLLLD
jgi:hypothetical protein